MIDLELLEKLDTDCINKLKGSSLWSLINPPKKAYPRLTRLFYVKLNQVPGKEFKITSRVAGIDIELDHEILAEILGCDAECDTDVYPDKRDAIKIAKRNSFYLIYQPLSNSHTQC